MANVKKNDVLTLKIRELKEKTREKVKERLLKEFEEEKRRGLYPWEGIWLSPQDIRKVQETMKKRDKVIFIEIILLFFIFGFFSYVLYRLMKIFLLP
ncbi:MAG: hypothetical protein DPW20_01715 [Candidatus Brocadia sp.]|uniref:Uncharacterized protein n=1 Tax=Candidatus Brocadia sinica JPN1 TaxID=1197129 RepID=A0ABQ0JWI4_9BACT|nr:MAG: hypothetical protein EDM70_02705 [Candidatus Brocadia sp. AMX2]KXK29645.1 MAG: hypothetical protein UZ01_02020 [Candidatus Brocadia sinica]MBC6931742.1 hypothetical protein [Candidatus Brocadia sp.]MBL1167402.1 hypothetical protein [Candidatus Brocadia sp. AMX1]GAN33051.1 hypothetical protein BROSI_A1568 [Candidatus Brocadia sinica JPN1]